MSLTTPLLRKPEPRPSEEEQLAKKYPDKSDKGATITATCINLLKNMVGAGLLNVCIGFQYSSVLFGLVDMVFSSFLCTCGFLLIGYCCAKTGARSFRTMMCVSVGPGAGKVIDVMLFFHTMFSCVGYITLIGDFSTKSMGGLAPGSIFATSRMASIGSISVFVLFPLACLRDLSSLKFTSALGLFVTACACAYVFWEVCYRWEEVNATQNLKDHWAYFQLDNFKTIALFNGSFSAHYNAPTYYAELKNKSFSRYAQVTFISFAIGTALFTVFGLAGFARFGDQVQGNLLKGYDADDKLALLSWMCMGLSTVFVFPLSFQRMRASWTALVNKPGGIHASSQIPWTTIVLLAVCVYFGTAFTDIAIIKMIKGATLGVSIMFIFPGLAFLGIAKKEAESGGRAVTWGDADMARQLSAPEKSTGQEPTAAIKAFSIMMVVVGVVQGCFALLVHYKII